MSTHSWIKMTDRAPTEADLPVLLWNARVPKMKYTATADALRCQLGLTCFTAWRPAPEPPREETQWERDQAAFIQWCNDNDVPTWKEYNEPWHAALAYERKQVLKLLPRWNTPDNVLAARDTISAIRARCGGGAK